MSLKRAIALLLYVAHEVMGCRAWSYPLCDWTEDAWFWARLPLSDTVVEMGRKAIEDYKAGRTTPLDVDTL